MAHLWMTDDGPEQQWLAVPLDGDAFGLEPAADGSVRIRRSAGRCNIVLLRSGGADAGAETWLVLGTDGAVEINGEAPVAGICALRDRDELRVGARPMFLSLERIATVTTFAGAARQITCPRCTNPIEREDAIVRCPGCSAMFHQSERWPCWTDDGRCMRCPHPTDLDASHRWTPVTR